MKGIFNNPSIEELQQSIADQARKSRLVKGYTQSELSRVSNVSLATIRRFEKTGEISLYSLLKIANALDETKTFQSLFPKSDFYNFMSTRIYKRPKLHSNGTYHSTRIPSPRELEKFLDLEDSPDSFQSSVPRKHDWKKPPKPIYTWDPIEERKKLNQEQDL